MALFIDFLFPLFLIYQSTEFNLIAIFYSNYLIIFYNLLKKIFNFAGWKKMASFKY